MTDSASLSAPFHPSKPNGQPAFAPRLADVADHSFPDTPWWRAGLLSRDRTADEATKEYVAVSDMEAFVEVEGE